MNTVDSRKSASARVASNFAWKRIAVPFISTQWQATKRPCTWKSGSMCTSTSLGAEAPRRDAAPSALEARLRCVIIAPFERPVVPEV